MQVGSHCVNEIILCVNEILLCVKSLSESSDLTQSKVSFAQSKYPNQDSDQDPVTGMRSRSRFGTLREIAQHEG